MQLSSLIVLTVPIVAITLALITKNAYISLMVGSFIGALIYCNFDLMNSCFFIVSTLNESLSGNNINVLIFLVILGAIVVLINKTNISRVYAGFIGNKIKTKRGVLLLTGILSSIFFLDDYFSCLTTGSIVTPLARHKKIFPGRIAHVIHSTAIPVCILMPISSWAAAISSTLSDSGASDGLALFTRLIPYNFYAILSVFSVIAVSFFDISFFTMKKEEKKYIRSVVEEKNKLSNLTERDFSTNTEKTVLKDSLVKEFILKLVLPIVFLIVSCVFCLLYTGGITKGNNFLQALSYCDSSKGLLLGSIFTFVFMFFLYVLVLKAIKFRSFFDSIIDGLKEMSPAVVILTLAWTLGTIISKYLKIGSLICDVLKNNLGVLAFVPVLLFLFSAALSLATGTSWGTFAILIPVAYPVLHSQENTSILLASLAAILSGAAFGDNASPISDTTIMSATSAGCNPLIHSFTQLPYAVVNALISIFCFILAGFIKNATLIILIALLMLTLVLFFIKRYCHHSYNS